MYIKLSWHARKKIIERKIEKVWIEETIRFPNSIFRKGKKYYAIKKLNGFTLKVVYEKEKFLKVITLYFIK